MGDLTREGYESLTFRLLALLHMKDNRAATGPLEPAEVCTDLGCSRRDLARTIKRILELVSLLID